MGAVVELGRSGGQTQTGYLAQASDRAAPAIVVIQEWWGVQGQIKGICDRYAALGYHALSPDLYSGRTVAYHDSAAASAEMAALDHRSATDGIVRAAARFLGAPGRKVGITGYCLGGVIAVLAATRLEEFAASVCYYGLPPTDLAEPGDVCIPLQGHFANADTWCRPEHVDALENALKRRGRVHEIYRYEAPHGFCNEEVQEFRPDLAEMAWQRGLDFWHRYLDS